MTCLVNRSRWGVFTVFSYYNTVKFYDAGGNKYLAEVNGISVGHLYKTNPSKLIEQVKTVANNKEVSDFAI